MGILSLEWIVFDDADAVKPDENDPRSICKVKDRRCNQPAFAIVSYAKTRLTRIALGASLTWCKSQMSRIYSVLLRLNNGPHA
jgi:hypothetical protein